MTSSTPIGQLDRDTVLNCSVKPGAPGAVCFIVRKPYERDSGPVWVDPKLLPNYSTLGTGVRKA